LRGSRIRRQLLSAAFSGAIFFSTDLFPQAVAIDARRIAPQFAAYLDPAVNEAALALRVKKLKDDLEIPGHASSDGFSFGISPSNARSIFIAVTDAQGAVLNAAPPGVVLPGAPLAQALSPSEMEPFNAAARGETDEERIARRGAEGAMAAAAPIFAGSSKKLAGILFVRISEPFSWRWLAAMMRRSLLAAFGIGLFASVVGTLFGFLTARQFTRRLDAIARAAGEWGRGDFTAAAPATPNDELGRLAERLNAMASELKKLIVLEGEVASLRERNRLALDLHDTVKQQVFACAMQIGAAEALLDGDPAAARTRLHNAGKIAHQARHDLTAVIHELLPAAPASRPLADSLRDFIENWRRQNRIEVDWHWEEKLSFRPAAAQTLLRMARECFANIARHSGATRAGIEFSRETSPATDQRQWAGLRPGFDAGGHRLAQSARAGRRIAGRPLHAFIGARRRRLD
jgi:NarL family two-component system sensor histidine kinase LiaS